MFQKNSERRSAGVLLIFSQQMKRYILLLALFFTACAKPANVDRTIAYYDTRVVIETAIRDLESRKPKVTKTWKYAKAKESRVVTDIDWGKELKLFLDTDINKSSFVSSYDSTVAPERITYFLKTGEKLPIKSISIALDTLTMAPVELHAVRTSENYFFTTQADLRLTLENEKVKAYDIQTVQKLLWFEADSTVVQGEILH